MKGFKEIYPGLWYEEATGLPWSTKRSRWGIDGPPKRLLSKNVDGYFHVNIEGKVVMWHRLVWEYFNGLIPDGYEIDHINGKRGDNRIDNLRLVSLQQNCMNKGKSKNNTSGYPGISWSKQKQKWIARIGFKGKRIHLGYFTEYEDAVAARKDAELKYFGKFRRL